MRHCVIALIILALTLGFCVISSHAVRAACDETLSLLQRAQHAADRADFDGPATSTFSASCCATTRRTM